MYDVHGMTYIVWRTSHDVHSRTSAHGFTDELTKKSSLKGVFKRSYVYIHVLRILPQFGRIFGCVLWRESLSTGVYIKSTAHKHMPSSRQSLMPTHNVPVTCSANVHIFMFYTSTSGISYIYICVCVCVCMYGCVCVYVFIYLYI